MDKELGCCSAAFSMTIPCHYTTTALDTVLFLLREIS